ncbi:MAG: rhomboid family intramembrane serine protease [Bacteroidales bacterium]|nr:rhomboid family intramembrane serine protease [Bacteroidales bacterium]
MNSQYSPTGFSFLPVVVKNLLIINGILFLADLVMPRFGIDLSSILGLHFFMASDFHIYQIFTYMFMHGNFTHLFFNMFALWMFGNTLENIWGPKRFLLFYILCGLGAGLMQEGVQYIEYVVKLSQYQTVNLGGGNLIPMSQYLNMMTTVGASGAIYGLLLAFGMMFPNSLIYLYFFVPIKAKWFVIGYAVIELLAGVMSASDGVAHFAHLGGMLMGLIILLIWKKKGRLY